MGRRHAGVGYDTVVILGSRRSFGEESIITFPPGRVFPIGKKPLESPRAQLPNGFFRLKKDVLEGKL